MEDSMILFGAFWSPLKTNACQIGSFPSPPPIFEGNKETTPNYQTLWNFTTSQKNTSIIESYTIMKPLHINPNNQVAPGCSIPTDMPSIGWCWSHLSGFSKGHRRSTWPKKKYGTNWTSTGFFRVTFLVVLSDLFRAVGDLQLGDKKVTAWIVVGVFNPLEQYALKKWEPFPTNGEPEKIWKSKNKQISI